MPVVDRVRVHRNPRAAPATEPYGTARSRILSRAGFAAADEEIRRWPGYSETPLRRLPRLGARLAVADLLYKDEGSRFGLKSFKALGGAYAVFRLLKHAVEARSGARDVGSQDLIAGRWRSITQAVTVTCATDGNHGRSVAWGAQIFGCRCVIYVHGSVSEARCAAIAHYGADVVRVPGNYDDSVRHAAGAARENGWTVVSDTTYEGYRDIPIDVMHGYGVMSHEIVRTMADAPPSHVLVQAGVGALAASVCAAFWLAWEARRPRLVIVEPIEADCHFRSALAGRPVAVTGRLDTVMAGLACGEVSPLAWEIVDAGASAYVAVDDRFALDAVRALASPAAGDPAIVAGETGASGLAALLAVQNRDRLRQQLGLDTSSRVLLIGSEGDTDPELYRRIVSNRDAMRSRAE
jgi:diaminopropionate ammonia-lyase